MPLRIKGSVQHYDWGDPSFLPAMLGLPEDGSPWAEWWIGTHPVAPSTVVDSEHEQPLHAVTGPLPFLVKVLACNQPLSLQTHPDSIQARQGFERENRIGIGINDPARTYKDSSDKPELLIALTEFEALCGFKDIDTAIADLIALGWADEADVLDMNGVDGYVLWAFDQLDAPDMGLAPRWLRDIAAHWPDDTALRVAPLLNHVVLSPGEAISLPPGNLHAYLKGAGFEVMNSSDNVIRAGFTNKHKDKHELQRVMDTTPLENPVVYPDRDGNIYIYPTPTDAWTVTQIHVDSAADVAESTTARIMVVTEGTCNVGASGHAFLIEPGESLHLVGDATVWIVGSAR